MPQVGHILLALVLWQLLPLARILCTLHLADLLQIAERFVQQKDGIVDQQIDEAQKDRWIFGLDVDDGEPFQLTEPLPLFINFPQIIHNSVHRTSIVKLLLKLYTLARHFNAHENTQQIRNDFQPVRMVGEQRGTETEPSPIGFLRQQALQSLGHPGTQMRIANTLRAAHKNEDHRKDGILCLDVNPQQLAFKVSRKLQITHNVFHDVLRNALKNTRHTIAGQGQLHFFNRLWRITGRTAELIDPARITRTELSQPDGRCFVEL
uniref:Putative secreted protein n=1 Tax=Anopheles darlingi TaxID=43151 RepID=A0A2M4D2E3_ANODA